MKASLNALTVCLLLLVPVATAHAQAPLLSPIPNVSLNAGSSMNVNVVAVDETDRTIQITADLPAFATLNTPTIGTGSVVTTLTLAPTSAFIGDYTAAVTATAGGVSSVRVFQITVNAAGSNRAPTVSVTPLQEVAAGTALGFEVVASDADGDAITSLTVSGLPAGSTFTPNGSNTSGAFTWTPGVKDVGEYDILFAAANALSGAAMTHIRVTSPPSLAITPIDDVTVAGGGSVSVPVQATGVPGSFISLTAALPAFATLNPPGTGTGAVNTTVTVSPPVGSGGTYHASITAISQGASVTELFDIIVTGSGGGDNRAPVLTAPASQMVAIGSTLSFDVTAVDPDGDHVDLFGSALPPGSSFLDHGDDTGTFTWSPVNGQAGSYTASFTGLDNRGGAGSASTIITVTGGTSENHAPTLSAPATQQVDEGASLTFTVTATDTDSDSVALSANSVPLGATFSDLGNNTGTFSWTPDSTQSGTYVVEFLGSDGNGGIGTASTTIAVRDIVRPGSDEVPGKACLIGKFKAHRDTTWLRLKPVGRSFNLGDVDLSSIRLRFHGESIAAGHARIERYCRGHGHDDDHHAAGTPRYRVASSFTGDHDDDDDEDDRRDNCGVTCDDHGNCGNGHGHDDDDCDDHHGDDDCDDHHGNGHCDHQGNGYGHDHHGDDCDCSDHHGDDDCDDDHGGGHGHGDDDRHTGGHHGTRCDTLGIRACFSTQALLSQFEGATLPCALLDAQLLATLTNGTTVVATFGRGGHGNDDGDDDGDDHGDDHGDDDGDDHGDDDGDDHGDDDGDDRDDDDGDDDRGDKSKNAGILNVSLSPNPVNPKTELSFTMSNEGTVRVSVYDMQGRVVKTLLNDFRVAGQQRLTWDGSNERNVRVPSGLYFVRIHSKEGSVIKRVTVVK